MKRILLIVSCIASFGIILFGQIDPKLQDGAFTPSIINVGATSTLSISFANGINGNTIQPGDLQIQVNIDDQYYESDGITPTGDAAAFFAWTYAGNGVWFGENNVNIFPSDGGEMVFTVTGIQNTNGNVAYSNATLFPQVTDKNYDDNTLPNDGAGLRVDAALPIQLLAFSAEKQELQSYLQWATATEINNEYFQVERSSDGENFDPIGQVAGAGNSSLRKDYYFIDAHPIQGVNYYRLRQVDVDGLYSFSPIRALKFDLREHVFIYPNPSKSYAIVETPDVLRGCTMEVFDIHGKKYVEIELNSDKQEVMMDNWPSGSYTVKIVKKETHYEDTRTLIKQQ